MTYKGLLIDLDHTLYNYELVHEGALKVTMDKFSSQFGLTVEDAHALYEYAKKENHKRLNGTASSHNRLIYFQMMLEKIGAFDMKTALELDDFYWAHYFELMKPEADALTFLKEVNVPKCLVTDFYIRPQYEKLIQLGMDEWIDHIVTSEEAGHEKPHPYMFMLALHKLGLQPHECLMIGDSYKKDCLGASAMGIDSILYKGDPEKEDLQKGIYVKQSFHEIIHWLKD